MVFDHFLLVIFLLFVQWNILIGGIMPTPEEPITRTFRHHPVPRVKGRPVDYNLEKLIEKPFSTFEKESSLHLNLPKCDRNSKEITKGNPNIKGILCPMFRDEEGFLTEWIAFYKVMGFDHIMFFDDGSTDKSLEELQPWIDIGFVSVKTNWSVDAMNLSPYIKANHFKSVMAAKSLLETECKLQAIKWGYHYFVSLDLDEYMFPLEDGKTVVDELHRVLTVTGRNSYCLNKYSYPATPHILEPVDLLTIEAYQSRMNSLNKMNYFAHTAPKCAYPLYLRPNFTETTQRYVAECCRFHGCEKQDLISNYTFCSDNSGEKDLVHLRWLPWIDAFQVNHYTRSLEKFSLKQQTWHTAGGETKELSRGYTLKKYFERSVGWIYDPIALRYSCQVRKVIREITKENIFYRKGNFWYRNPEFGKEYDKTDQNKWNGAFHRVINPYNYQRYQKQPDNNMKQEIPL